MFHSGIQDPTSKPSVHGPYTEDLKGVGTYIAAVADLDAHIGARTVVVRLPGAGYLAPEKCC